MGTASGGVGIAVDTSIYGTVGQLVSGVYYVAGGGCGAAGSTGGNGGGGANGSGVGATNTGGGGGANGAVPSRGGIGGTGIAVVSYLSAYRLATTTGTVTYSLVGSRHVYKFTGSGTITF
jgi:hypothetical protein